MVNFHNTLYVTAAEAFVKKDGEALRVVVGDDTRVVVPMHHLSSVVCFATARMSAEAMAACSERGVGVVFLGYDGRYLARVDGPAASGAATRRTQYRAADDPALRLRQARAFIAGKIANTRTLLLRAQRTRKQTDFAAVVDRLEELTKKAVAAPDVDTLLGWEGEAASRYFDVFDELLDSDGFAFQKRTRRPAHNAVNAMLNFGYAVLVNDCGSALQAAGLDPAVGLLHTERAGRPALALDLAEEFRSIFVDRMVIAMVNLGQVRPEDFTTKPTGGIEMSDRARRTFIEEYQRRKGESVTHPEMVQATTWAAIPHYQACLLARAIRENGEYVPFLLR